ncbi:hypothetical protein TURU_046497 [Turdus rufiventris]|nr:hypothetical protein TURU_046497 [Turdus rufiventris]
MSQLIKIKILSPESPNHSDPLKEADHVNKRDAFRNEPQNWNVADYSLVVSQSDVNKIATTLDLQRAECTVTKDGETGGDWRLADMMAIYKKIWIEDLGNYGPVSLSLVPDHIDGADHIECHQTAHTGQPDSQTSQHGFVKGRSSLSNLISFYDSLEEMALECIRYSITSQSREAIVQLGSALGWPHLEFWGSFGCHNIMEI